MKPRSGVTKAWHGPAFIQTVYQAEKRKAKATAKMGEAIAKTNMQPSPGPAGINPSSKKEYPAIQSGTLQQNIHSELMKMRGTKIAARWGVYAQYAKNLPEGGITPVGAYAFWLETGTGKMAPRPWLTMSMEEVKQKGWVDVGAVSTGAI